VSGNLARLSLICRGGMFPAAGKAERAARIHDTRRAVDEAVEIIPGTYHAACPGERVSLRIVPNLENS
jgi:hypothetical protein